MGILDALGQSYQEHSLLWLLLSGVVGGIVGAAVKFSFENVLGPGYTRWLENKAALRRHSDPLLRAADALRVRMDNMLDHAGKGWFETSQYYRLSTLYLVGCCFGVARLLEREAFLEYAVRTRQGRRLGRAMHGLFESLSGWDAFDAVGRDEIAADRIYGATVLRHGLTAVGEVMTYRSAEGRLEVIDFVEFVRKYEKDDEFRRWFTFVEQPLQGLQKGRDDAKWNRAVVFALALRMLVHRLDPKGRRTDVRPFGHLDSIHPGVRVYLERRARECGYDLDRNLQPRRRQPEAPGRRHA